LAAAHDLSQAGRTVTILEARNRTGGRIHTIHLVDDPLPVELGAEFVHGEAEETLRIVRAAKLLLDQLPDDHLRAHNGKLSAPGDFWKVITQALRQLARRVRSRPDDVALAVALTADRNRATSLFRHFVEGYHAADPAKVSARWLAAEDPPDERSTRRQFRLVNGNDGIIQWLESGLNPQRTALRLNTAAKAVRWERGDVRVLANGPAGNEIELRAKAVVVTVPLQILKSEVIRFEPALKRYERSLRTLEMAAVFRIVIEFREAFWTDEFLAQRMSRTRVPIERINFIHAPDEAVPTWWSSAPQVAPRLVGWAGSQKAIDVLAMPEGSRLDRTLESLSRILAVRRPWLDDLVLRSWHHDWSGDPLSQGAYSYVGVGGQRSPRSLAHPIEGTVFLAGEATSEEEMATVAGALASGRRAAKQILAEFAER
jgi:monoamine oxidase